MVHAVWCVVCGVTQVTFTYICTSVATTWLDDYVGSQVLLFLNYMYTLSTLIYFFVNVINV